MNWQRVFQFLFAANAIVIWPVWVIQVSNPVYPTSDWIPLEFVGVSTGLVILAAVMATVSKK